MNLGDLLARESIDPRSVIVMRHRPAEPELNKVLRWLATDKPEVFNAYQQTQGPKLEKVMSALQGVGFVASFIGHEPGKAIYVGLYRLGVSSKPLTLSEYWQVPAYIEMKAFGMRGFTPDRGRASLLWFDLCLTDFYAHWKGKLIVGWPPPERSWWRRAHRNDFPVLAVLDDSALVTRMPEWNEISLSWEELGVLPARWRAAIEQWRGIYYIFDASDGKGYVGSAYGAENLLGRWLNYSATGHGGNRLLRERDPRNFRFSILQRLSPDLDAASVIGLEATWKERLHTRAPLGLNEN
jgi:hypothetical protein